MSGHKNKFLVNSGTFVRIDERRGFEGYLREVSKGLRTLYWSLPNGTVLHQVSQADSEFSEWRFKLDIENRRIERRSEPGELFRIDVDRCEGLKCFIENLCTWDSNADYGPSLFIVVDPMKRTLWAVTDGENDETPGAAEARLWGWGFSKPKIGDLYRPLEHTPRRSAPERRADEIEQYLICKYGELSAATLRIKGRPREGSPDAPCATARKHFVEGVKGDWTNGTFKKAWEAFLKRYPE